MTYLDWRLAIRGLVIGTLMACPPALGRGVSVDAKPGIDVATATIAQLNQAIDDGTLTSERLVRLSLERIRSEEPNLHALLAINPHALQEARALDAERRRHGRRSSLHGIPVLLKDNINTRDLATTLGFYGLKGAIPYADAAVVARLRAAGAIILAKTNLSELTSGPPMSSLGGQTRNPYNLAYSPAGSSNGTAVGVAAGYAPLGIATDTTGSARWPAATSGVVGMRPTMGRISARGVQPNAPTLDTVGPIARSVEDARLAMAVLDDDRSGDLTRPLSGHALRGVRIGFPRRTLSGDDPAVDAVVAQALASLEASGATIVDIDLPDWLPTLADSLQATIVQTESVPSLDAYLAASFSPAFPQSHHRILEMSERLVRSPVGGVYPNPGRLAGYRWEAAGPPASDPLYRSARTQGVALVQATLQAVLERNHVCAIVYPTQTTRINRLDEAPKRTQRGLFGNFGSVIASVAGWPDISVPAGQTPEGLPVGLSFLGPAFGDAPLLAYAFAFEQHAGGYRPPAQAGQKR